MRALRYMTLAALVTLAACDGAPKPGAAPPPAAAGPAAPAPPAGVIVPAGVYKIDPTHALLQWSIRHMGLSNYTAKFTRYDATITLDPQNIEASKISLTLDPRSVRTDYPADYAATHKDTGYDSWDEQLALDPRFLDAGKTATVTFVSTAIKKTGPLTADVTGDLTFRGVTKPVTLQVSLIGQAAKHPMTQKPVIALRAEGELTRTDFGMPRDFLGDKVKVLFDAEFQRTDAAAGA